MAKKEKTKKPAKTKSKARLASSSKRKKSKKTDSVFGPSPVQDKLISGLEGMDIGEAEKVRKKMLLLDAELNFEKAKLIYNTLKEQDLEFQGKAEEVAKEENKAPIDNLVFRRTAQPPPSLQGVPSVPGAPKKPGSDDFIFTKPKTTGGGDSAGSGFGAPNKSGEAEGKKPGSDDFVLTKSKLDTSNSEGAGSFRAPEKKTEPAVKKSGSDDFVFIGPKGGDDKKKNLESESSEAKDLQNKSKEEKGSDDFVFIDAKTTDKKKGVSGEEGKAFDKGESFEKSEEEGHSGQKKDDWEKELEDEILQESKTKDKENVESGNNVKTDKAGEIDDSPFNKSFQERLQDKEKTIREKGILLDEEEKTSKNFGKVKKTQISDRKYSKLEKIRQEIEAEKKLSQNSKKLTSANKGEEQQSSQLSELETKKTSMSGSKAKKRRMKGIEVFEEHEEESVENESKKAKKSFDKRLLSLLSKKTDEASTSFSETEEVEKEELGKPEENRDKRSLFQKINIFLKRGKEGEDKETIDLRKVSKANEPKKFEGPRMRAVDIGGEAMEGEDVLDLKTQVAGQKHVALDASEAPSYQERELDLRDEKTKKKERRKRMIGEKKPVVSAPFYKDQQKTKKPDKQKGKLAKRQGRIQDKERIRQQEIDDLYNDLKFSDIPEGPKDCSFPEGFLWGTSTSAYQVEGNIINDWSLWEKGGKRSLHLMKSGKAPEDYICGQGVDSFNRYEEDLDLAASLNTNAIRFGLEWARIQPRRRTWDMGAIDHYRKVLQAAKKRGLTTAVTLWHWTNPLWFMKRGGWENEKNINYFKQYVKLCTEEFGSHIDYWVTLNEPMLAANYGYLLGYFPPQKRNFMKFKRVKKNLINAHIGAYNMIHRRFRQAQVSITNLSNCFEPNIKGLPSDVLLSRIVENYGHNKFFDKIKDHIDYVGIDYYRKIYISTIPPFMRNKGAVLTDMGWEIDPRGLYELLKVFSVYNKPIMILENGLADADDKMRAQFIKEHLYWAWRAIQDGVDLRGYFHWSLLDNFEWDKGWEPKFGLFEVDRETFERKKRASADVYAEIAKGNTLII